MSVLDVVRILRTTKQADAAAQAAEAAKVARVAEQTKKAQSVQRIQVGNEVIEFPASMKDEEIKAVLKKNYPPKPAAAPATIGMPSQQPVVQQISGNFKNKFLDEESGTVIEPIVKLETPKGWCGIETEPPADHKLPLYKWKLDKTLNSDGPPTHWGTFKIRGAGGEKIDNPVWGMKVDVQAFMLMGQKDIKVMAVNGVIPEAFADFYVEWMQKMSTPTFAKRMADTKLIVGSDDYTASGKYGGWYADKLKMAFLDKRAMYEAPHTLYQRGVHEIGHAATVWSYENVANVKRTWNTLYQEWLLRVSAPLDKNMYMWENPKELIAEGMSNPGSARVLKNMPYDGPHQAPNGTTAWDAYVFNVSRFLGIGALTAGTAEFEFAEKIVAPQQVESDGA